MLTVEAAPINTTSLDDLEAQIDADVPEPKEDDGDLAVVDFDRPMLERYIALKTQINDLEREQDEIGDQIRKNAEVLRLSVAQKDGALVRSILLAGQLRYTAQNRWSKIKTARGEGLARKFNGKFAQSFRDVKEYELDRAALAAQAKDPDIAEAFVMLRKAGVLVQSRYYKPTEAFFLSYTLDGDFRKLAESEGIKPVSQLALPKSVSAK